jgi:hypothetical protein
MLLSSACVSVPGSALEKPRGATLALDSSRGLPSEGLWRQNIVLADMNNDGFLDVVAPPQRKGNKESQRPSVFLWSRESGRWNVAPFTYPSLPDYDYGAIAAGDLNGDNLPDLVLAVHTGRLIVLYNTGEGKFLESPFAAGKRFHSRAVKLADINNDGWLDIVSISEGPFSPTYKPEGILVGINKKGQGWDVRLIEESAGMYSDFFALGDLNRDGNIDIVSASMGAKLSKKYVWFGDGRGGFSNDKDVDFDANTDIVKVTAGDIDGDGFSEVAMVTVSTSQTEDMIVVNRGVKVLKWQNGKFEDISGGVDSIKKAYALGLADIHGERMQELSVLTAEGIEIFQYSGVEWIRTLLVPVGGYQETSGAYCIEAGKNSDGSAFVVFNLGDETLTLKRGLKAYTLPPGSLPD